MTILLRWLVNNAWVFYVLCAIGVLVYLGRALAAQRERQLAVFSLERETATSRLVQSIVVMLVFTGLGVLIFASSTVFLPTLPPFNGEPMPEPTAASGLEPPTVAASPTPTAAAVVTTFTPAAADTTTPAPPIEGEPGETPTVVPAESPPPEETPLPEATSPPDVAIIGQTNARFGDFAALVGYSLPSGQLSASAPVPLILYWQALEGTSPTNYVVFTHMVASDGHLVAQNDSQPAGGGRPTTGWTPGQQIADPHPLAFVDTAYQGPATILVGMYDADGVRVLTDTGASYAVLPVSVEIVP